MLCFNVVFTARPHNGSTIAVVSRDLIPAKVRELPVVGSTGAFRGVTGIRGQQGAAKGKYGLLIGCLGLPAWNFWWQAARSAIAVVAGARTGEKQEDGMESWRRLVS
ncbi:hypothetical protein EJB05_28375, partial [Eragrostis curvula]